jgi:radical SAM protein with 4Fe4S-binding SPASM domain
MKNEEHMENAHSNISGIRNIENIFIEISNICNYASVHRKCPLHNCAVKEILPSVFIKKIIDELSSIDYAGMIAFHNYNEPLIDPRLFYLVDYTKKILNNSIIRIRTNGFHLTQNIIEEMEQVGVDQIFVSLYSQSEEERIKKIKFNKLNISLDDFYKNRNLDDRKNIYTRDEIHCNMPCYSLTHEIIIRYTGDVVLCCLDYENRYIFGNIKESSLSDILDSDAVKDTQSLLSNGKRLLPICKRCDWQRNARRFHQPAVTGAPGAVRNKMSDLP